MIRKITDEMTPFIHSARESERETTVRALGRRYDACVIGSGPGGSVAAATLALSGLKVALVERGPFVPVSSNNFRVLDQSNRMGSRSAESIPSILTHSSHTSTTSEK